MKLDPCSPSAFLCLLASATAVAQEPPAELAAIEPPPAEQRTDRPAFTLTMDGVLQVRPAATTLKLGASCAEARVEYGATLTVLRCLDEMQNPTGAHLFTSDGKPVDLQPLVAARKAHTTGASSCLRPVELAGRVVAPVTLIDGAPHDCGMDSQTSIEPEQVSVAVFHALDPATGAVTEHKATSRCSGISTVDGRPTLTCALEPPLPKSE